MRTDINIYPSVQLLLFLAPFQRLLSRGLGFHQINYLVLLLIGFYWIGFYFDGTKGKLKYLSKMIYNIIFNSRAFQLYLYNCLLVHNYTRSPHGKWLLSTIIFLIPTSFIYSMVLENFLSIFAYTLLYTVIMTYINIWNSGLLVNPNLNSWSNCLQTLQSKMEFPIKNKLASNTSLVYMTSRVQPLVEATKPLVEATKPLVEATKPVVEGLKSAGKNMPKGEMPPGAAETVTDIARSVAGLAAGTLITSGAVLYDGQKQREQNERHHLENLEQARINSEQARANLEEAERSLAKKRELEADGILVTEGNKLLENLQERLNDPKLTDEERSFYAEIHQKQTEKIFETLNSVHGTATDTLASSGAGVKPISGIGREFASPKELALLLHQNFENKMSSCFELVSCWL